MKARATLVLMIAVALLAATSAVLKWLQTNQPLGLDGDQINFCNVLFVGNTAAGLVALAFFGPRRIVRDLAVTSAGTRGLLLLNSLFAVAIPTLLFIALQNTSVTNIVLLSRFESVALAVLSAVLLRKRIALLPWVGYGVIVAGILALVLAQTKGSLMRGELAVIGAALLQGIAALTSRKNLEGLELGSFVFFRNLVSAVVFFALGSWHFGLGHFADAFGPKLWGMMVVYAAVVIVVGQLAWYRSLQRLPASTVANASMTSPLLGIFFAWLLLGEVPNGVQWLGAAIILGGMVLTRFGGERDAEPPPMVEKSLAGG